MLCPSCRASYTEYDLSCPECGADLTVPSTSLVSTNASVPAIFQGPQLPRLVAGVGALAVGVGIELLRRNLLARLTRTATRSSGTVSALGGLREILTPQREKPIKLRKGDEVHETVVYLRRVIRRAH